MSYEQDSKLNDDIVKIKKRLKLIEGKFKYIIVVLVCVFVTIFIKNVMQPIKFVFNKYSTIITYFQ